MTSKKEICILIVTHKPFKIPNCEYLLPIHAGRSIATQISKDGKINKEDYDWLLKNTIGDDTGDNISEKNRYYSECSALYWTWKNYEKIGNPEYIGFMHYRRYFIFRDNYYQNHTNKNPKGLVIAQENFIDKDYEERIGLKTEIIKDIMEHNDMVVSYESDFNLTYPNGYTSLKEDYGYNIPGTEIKDYDLMLKIINQYYPEYAQIANELSEKPNKPMYQMFIMKKEDFFEYCEFLFDVMFKIEKQVNFDTYSINGKRSLGYLAEIFLTFYVKKKEMNNTKIARFGVSFIKYPETKNQINKIINDKSNNFIFYLFTKIQYLLEKNPVKKEELKVKYKTISNKIKEKKQLKKLLNNTRF